MLDALTFHRVAHRLHSFGLTFTARIVTRLGRHLFSAHIPPEVEIGAGTTLGYGGIGIIIHGQAQLGRDVLVSPGVVIGGRSGLPGAPIVGDGVMIGAGAKILGPIRIGAGASIGANAVVLRDVPPGAVMVGVPARPVARHLKILDGGG